MTYEFEVRANGCINAATTTEVVTVNPTPEMTVTNNAPTLRPGSSTDIQVSSVTANAQIELIGVTISPDAGGVSNYTGSRHDMDSCVRIPRVIADNLVNSTDNIQTITYRFEVSASGFTSTAIQTAVVTVNPCTYHDNNKYKSCDQQWRSRQIPVSIRRLKMVR
ncbi:MAG: hypothetical protein U5K79_22495 [Cyclobacteriaceae bacterium]|nr:hypothetical protein [Cyclobacteriaceae bacterium]